MVDGVAAIDVADAAAEVEVEDEVEADGLEVDGEDTTGTSGGRGVRSTTTEIGLAPALVGASASTTSAAVAVGIDTLGSTNGDTGSEGIAAGVGTNGDGLASAPASVWAAATAAPSGPAAAAAADSTTTAVNPASNRRFNASPSTTPTERSGGSTWSSQIQQVI